MSISTDVQPRSGTGTRMRARAHVATERRSSRGEPARSCVSTLHSEAPLVLRLARAKTPEPWAADVRDAVRVALMAGAAGPVGGDELHLTVEVGPGSTLVLSEISPTLLLPGPYGERSHTSVRIRIAEGATLIWLPEPMIAAQGCDHVNDVDVRIDRGGRFFMREEILLGRHGEVGGHVSQRISVSLDGRPLHRQDLEVGTPETDSPSILGTYRAVGSSIIVEPSWIDHPPRAHRIASAAAVLPLVGPAAVITALGRDNLELREHLTTGLQALGTPWAPPSAPPPRPPHVERRQGE